MARLARVVAPGVPHHVTQRGNRRQQTFFSDDDYQVYLDLLSERCALAGVEIWAYCLMPNHVHLIAVPSSEEALRQGIGEAHRRYTRHVNFTKGWKGYLWQGRFASFPMDETHLLAAARYIELNPVRAGICRSAEEYPWSSVHLHKTGKNKGVFKARPLLDIVGSWRDFLGAGLTEKELAELRGHENTGRPAGSENFIKELENRLGRQLQKGKPGPKTGPKIGPKKT